MLRQENVLWLANAVGDVSLDGILCIAISSTSFFYLTKNGVNLK
jgi:hypothetical protein